MKGRITERVIATGQWKAKSAIRVGGEPEGFAQTLDMTLARDAAGNPFIPGASIAGAARSAVARRRLDTADFQGDQIREPRDVQVLFGGMVGDTGPVIDGVKQKAPPDYQSCLLVWDAAVVPGNKGAARSYRRDGVQIDAHDGLAKDQHKYDFEVLPAGTKFLMRLGLHVWDELPGGVSRDQLLAAFREVLEALGGRVRLGARTRRGLGEGGVERWSVYRMDMRERNHVMAWLKQPWWDGQWPAEVPRLDITALPEPVQGDCDRRLRVECDLELKTSLLVRSHGHAPDDPDAVQLTEEGRQILPGTSLGGAIRQRCAKIAQTIADRTGDEGMEKLLENMFGPLHDRKKQNKLYAGRVWVSEPALERAELWLHTRVTIDRFTGGAMEARLFETAPAWPGKQGTPGIRVRLELELPSFVRAPGDGTEEERQAAAAAHELRQKRMIGLLVLALKDLATGDLPLGGEVAVGRGVFHATGIKITHPDWGELPVAFEQRAADERLESCVAALWTAEQEGEHAAANR